MCETAPAKYDIVQLEFCNWRRNKAQKGNTDLVFCVEMKFTVSRSSLLRETDKRDFFVCVFSIKQKVKVNCCHI